MVIDLRIFIFMKFVYLIENISLILTGCLSLMMAFMIFPFDRDHFGVHVEAILVKWKRVFIVGGLVIIFGGIYRFIVIYL